MKVAIRDVIRAYDFKPMVGRDDCYVEGEVLEVNNMENGYQAYKIQVTKDSFSGRVGEIIYVPWRIFHNDYDGRVMNLSRI